jgi:mannose-6-phosphate isomerase-like protein (cupin superfamily)
VSAGDQVHEVARGEGYAVGDIDAMGEGYGFRKIRPALDVTAFGINAIVIPPRWEAGPHYHDEQEEVYFVHRGQIEMEFGDGSRHLLGPGGVARVDAATVRRVRNPSDEDAVYVVAGGKDGYVGRDGRLADGTDATGHKATRYGAPLPPEEPQAGGEADEAGASASAA